MTSTDLTLQLTAPVVSTQWLADHLGADNLVVLDATVLRVTDFTGGTTLVTGHEEFVAAGHVPGAVFADVMEVFSDPDGANAFAKPSAAQFEAAAASVGVDNRTAVVVYDTAVGQWAARVWWLFKALGYDNVAVLNGGFVKWLAESRPTETGHVEPRSGTSFTAIERDDLWVDKGFIERVVAGVADAALICAVPSKEFSGETGTRERRGHIPGSVNAPAVRLVDRETNAYLGADALRGIFGDVVDDPRPIVAYCAAGIAAASDALALTLLGRSDVAIYDGSLGEWSEDADAPLVTA